MAKTKVCNQCESRKGIEKNFNKKATGRDGYSAVCKECTSVNVKAWKKRTGWKPNGNAETRNQKRRDNYNTSTLTRAGRLISGAKERAKKKRIKVDLVPEDIAAKLDNGFCEVTGMPFMMEVDEGNGMHPLTPTLDQIEPSAGYTADNVQVVVFSYNALKGSGTAYQALQVARSLCNKSEVA